MALQQVNPGEMATQWPLANLARDGHPCIKTVVIKYRYRAATYISLVRTFVLGDLHYAVL